MRARKKRVEDYEKFGRQVTLPSLKKIDGCVGAHFIKIFEARKPEYLWLVFWRDQKALDQARTKARILASSSPSGATGSSEIAPITSLRVS